MTDKLVDFAWHDNDNDAILTQRISKGVKQLNLLRNDILNFRRQLDLGLRTGSQFRRVIFG